VYKSIFVKYENRHAKQSVLKPVKIMMNRRVFY